MNRIGPGGVKKGGRVEGLPEVVYIPPDRPPIVKKYK